MKLLPLAIASVVCAASNTVTAAELSAHAAITGLQFNLTDLNPNDGIAPSIAFVLGPAARPGRSSVSAYAYQTLPSATQRDEHSADPGLLTLGASAATQGSNSTVSTTAATFVAQGAASGGNSGFQSEAITTIDGGFIFDENSGDLSFYGLLVSPYTAVELSFVMTVTATASGVDMFPDDDFTPSATAVTTLSLRYAWGGGSNDENSFVLETGIAVTDDPAERTHSETQDFSYRFKNPDELYAPYTFSASADAYGFSGPYALPPVPEPSRVLLMLCGLVPLGVVLNRSRRTTTPPRS